MFKSSLYYIILYYKDGTLPKCFGHSCGHPKGDALQRIYYNSFWPNTQISLMHGHGLFKTVHVRLYWYKI